MFRIGKTLFWKRPKISKRFCSTIPDMELLMSLRKETGAPFSMVREALINTKNDKIEARKHISHSFTQRFSKISTRSQPLTNGLICVGYNSNSLVLLKMNCETDFVAKTDEFLHISGKALECFLSVNENSQVCDFSHDVYTEESEIRKLVEEFHLERHMKEISGKLGEKLEIGLVSLVAFSDRFFPGIYAHSSDGASYLGLPFPNSFGRVGSIVLMESGVDDHEYEISRTVAKQITGFNPFESSEEKDYQNALFRLMEQPFLGDSDIKVKDYLDKNSMRVVLFDREEHYT